MKVDPGKTSKEVVVSLSDDYRLEVTTLEGSVAFSTKESRHVLRFLTDLGIISPLSMLDLLGGLNYLREIAEKYSGWADMYEDLRKKWGSLR